MNYKQSLVSCKCAQPMIIRILCLVGLLLPAIAMARPTMLISSAVFPPFTTEAHNGFEDRLIPEMYRRAGFDSEVRRLPGQRGLLMVEDGYMDSTFSRVKGIVKNYDHLVQMKEPTFRRDFVVFSKNRNLDIKDWHSLAPLSVAIINGWKILEWNIKQYKSLQKVKDAKQLFRFLDSGRVDAVVYAKYSGLYLLNELGIDDVVIVGQPLASKDMCVILNQKHRSLLPELDRILRQMKQDGFYQKVFDETIGPLINQ